MVPAAPRSSLGSNASTAPEMSGDELEDDDDDKESDSSCLAAGFSWVVWSGCHCVNSQGSSSMSLSWQFFS